MKRRISKHPFGRRYNPPRAPEQSLCLVSYSYLVSVHGVAQPSLTHEIHLTLASGPAFLCRSLSHYCSLTIKTGVRSSFFTHGLSSSRMKTLPRFPHFLDPHFLEIPIHWETMKLSTGPPPNFIAVRNMAIKVLNTAVYMRFLR